MLGTSIVFLLYSLIFLLDKPMRTSEHRYHRKIVRVMRRIRYFITRESSKSSSNEYIITMDGDSCSFYLKMGALVFAIGSMIYTCLEISVFIENYSCFSVVLGIEPTFFIVFVVLQLYFVFQSSQVSPPPLATHKFTGGNFQIVTSRSKGVLWFGTIHLIATDICVWIRTLIDETQHEFTLIKQHEKSQDKAALLTAENWTFHAKEYYSSTSEEPGGKMHSTLNKLRTFLNMENFFLSNN